MDDDLLKQIKGAREGKELEVSEQEKADVMDYYNHGSKYAPITFCIYEPGDNYDEIINLIKEYQSNPIIFMEVDGEKTYLTSKTLIRSNRTDLFRTGVDNYFRFGLEVEEPMDYSLWKLHTASDSIIKVYLNETIPLIDLKELIAEAANKSLPMSGRFPYLFIDTMKQDITQEEFVKEISNLSLKPNIQTEE